jgi:Pvc16 N-terminal domain
MLPPGVHRSAFRSGDLSRTLAGVIAEVDEAVRALVRGDALDGTDVEVVFDAPTKDWSARRNAPTVNMYLYDIREDMRRRERGQVNEYDQRGFVVARHLPPRHFRLSYLVTAWTQRPEDEHRLLSALLSCFVRHDSIPDAMLTGPLRMGLPVALTVALPPPEDRSFADVWSALGGELKPSLDLVVSAPIDTGQSYPAGPVVQEPLAVTVADRVGDARSRRQGRRRVEARP